MKFDRSLFIDKFSIEAQEHLQKLNEGILRLEQGETDADLMADILRAAHTLKGSARMMGFKDINQVAHKLEDLLLELKEGRLQASGPLCDLVFQALDTIDASRQAIVDGTEESGPLAGQIEQVVNLLESAAQGGAIEGIPARSLPVEEEEPEPEPVALPPEAEPEPVAPPPEAEPEPEPAGLPPPIAPTPQVLEAPAAPPRTPPHKAPPEERIRVSAPKLDKTIRLTGEVIAAHRRAEMRQADLRTAWQWAREHWRQLRLHLDEADPDAAELLESGKDLHERLDQMVKQNREDVADLGRIVLELQQDTLGLRMQPVSTVFDTFPRAMRDLARERGKEVDLIIQGGETELDKQMLERISDPLMHMLRNAIDHGIEPPEDRQARDKPRRGTVWLRAYAMGGSIIIEVQDDGRGIPMDAIRERALREGIVLEETLRTMSDREVQNLIFLSGFSTSKIVSDISGRGVGLDVVRRNIIEELKGDISVETEEGRGTRFTLTLPLTLTTLRILFVTVNGRLFGLPVTYVGETTRVLHEDVIQVVDRQAIRVRDQIVPIALLSDVLGLPPQPGGDGGEASKIWLYLVIVQVADERCGFVVNQVVNEDDVLIKPLPQHLKRVGVLAGASIAPDGTIIPILHVPGLIRTVRGVSAAGPITEETERPDVPRILVVDDSLNTREIEKSILEARGYDVDLAKDGIDALRVIEQAPAAEGRAYYDLLIVDIEMPRLDGLSLTEQLRQDERYARVPIVIVSSRDKPEDRQRGLDVGADAYIVKGTFDQENLTTTVASLLGRAAP